MKKSELKKSLQELSKALEKLGKMKLEEASKEIQVYLNAIEEKEGRK
tara:strand:- start:2597 stop:2737 length:141 start_codon:yes stop_codon:yes gene_type:complete